MPSIFVYVLLQEAKKRMNAGQLNLATELAKLADAGEPGAEDALRALINEVWLARHVPASNEGAK